MSLLLRISCLACLLVAAVASPGSGQIFVDPGFDLFRTSPALTEFDFGSMPMPAGFFGPGSDPFDGIIVLDGGQVPQDACPNVDVTGIDTVVRRLQEASLPMVGSQAIVETEIVALSLAMTIPITVSYNGGQSPQQWDVEVELSPTLAPTGQMTIRRTHPNGGEFDTSLPVLPSFTFARLADTRLLDFGAEALPPIQFESFNDPWLSIPPIPGSCTSNWCPAPGGPMVLTSVEAQHGVDSECSPVVSGVGGVLPPPFSLADPHPNPTSASATIAYNLDNSGDVSITVYDVRGRLLTTLLDGYRPAGPGEVRLDMTSLSAGVYFLKMSSASRTITRKISVVR
jgi:hypothetical protein